MRHPIYEPDHSFTQIAQSTAPVETTMATAWAVIALLLVVAVLLLGGGPS